MPLGEESERYLLRVFAGGQHLRDVLLDTPGWTYSTAARAADGLTGAFEVTVAQVSASYGAGLAAGLVVSG